MVTTCHRGRESLRGLALLQTMPGEASQKAGHQDAHSTSPLPTLLQPPRPQLKIQLGTHLCPNCPKPVAQLRVTALLNTRVQVPTRVCPTGTRAPVPRSPDLGCVGKVSCTCSRAAAWAPRGRGDVGTEPLHYETSLHPRGAKSRFSERSAPDPDEIGHHKGLCIPGSLLEI